MTLATLENPENTYADLIRSTLDWWNLVGIDFDYNSNPSSLLGQPRGEHALAIEPAQPIHIEATSRLQQIRRPAHKASRRNNINDDYPRHHDEFIDWLSTTENLAEAEWSLQQILPVGPIEPEIMIIVAMPDQEGLSRNSLFSEDCSTLVVNMLKAIGCDSTQTYFASISVTRSFDGRIDTQFQDTLKRRMLHHIGLVQPKRIIIFGETPSHLFFGENLLTARKSLRFINHFSFKTEAIATFHPRTLNERPEFKSEAWKDLQLLSRVPSI